MLKKNWIVTLTTAIKVIIDKKYSSDCIHNFLLQPRNCRKFSVRMRLKETFLITKITKCILCLSKMNFDINYFNGFQSCIYTVINCLLHIPVNIAKIIMLN